MSYYTSLPPTVPATLKNPSYFQEFKSSFYASGAFSCTFLASIGVSQLTSINDTVKWMFSKVVCLAFNVETCRSSYFYKRNVTQGFKVPAALLLLTATLFLSYKVFTFTRDMWKSAYQFRNHESGLKAALNKCQQAPVEEQKCNKTHSKIIPDEALVKKMELFLESTHKEREVRKKEESTLSAGTVVALPEQSLVNSTTELPSKPQESADATPEISSNEFQTAFIQEVLKKNIKIPHPNNHEFMDWLRKPESREIRKNIFSLDFTSLAKLPEEIHLLPNLRVIKLSLDKDRTYPIDALAIFKDLPKLKILDISETNLTKDYLRCLEKHPNPEFKVNISMSII